MAKPESDLKPVIEAIGRLEDTLRRAVKKMIAAITNKNKSKVVFAWGVDKPKLKNERTSMPLELTITNEQQVKVRLNPRTDAGKPAKLDGVPTWAVVSGPGKVTPAADGLSADLISDDNDLSDTVYMVDGDADLGAGTEDVKDTITLHVTHANATNLGLVADQPVVKP